VSDCVPGLSTLVERMALTEGTVGRHGTNGSDPQGNPNDGALVFTFVREVAVFLT